MDKEEDFDANEEVDEEMEEEDEVDEDEEEDGDSVHEINGINGGSESPLDLSPAQNGHSTFDFQHAGFGERLTIFRSVRHDNPGIVHIRRCTTSFAPSSPNCGPGDAPN
jgi:hypothetical protein